MSPHILAICDVMQAGVPYSLANLAVKLGRHEERIRHQLRALEDEGYVEIRRTGEGEFTKRNLYYRTEKPICEVFRMTGVKPRWPDADPVLLQAMRAICEVRT